MAEKTEKKAQDKTKKKSGSGKTVLMMILIGCMVPFGLPTLLVACGLLPTVVALFTDTDENKSGLAAVGYMNLAGVLPFLIELWQKGQAMDVAMAIITEPSSWVVMLGAAGVGYLIMYAVPPMIGSVVLLNQEGRLRTLTEGVEQLEAIWGPDVTTTAPLSEVLRSRGL